MTTHDYNTIKILGKDLDSTMVLVGDSGGLSSIYSDPKRGMVSGLVNLETEHGFLLLDPDEEYTVLDEG